MGEAAVLRERRALRRSQLWPDRGAPAGHGRAVVLAHGFGVPARTLAPIGRWLAGAGWEVTAVPLGMNVACSTTAVELVVATAERAAGRASAPVALVGHSRGGLLARVAAVRRPDLVSTLVTVCTPWIVGPPDRPGVATTAAVLRSLRRRGIDLMGSIECGSGPCCTALRTEVRQVPEVGWIALWSSADSIAGTDGIPVGATRAVDLGTSHLGAVMSVRGWTEIGAALDLAGPSARPDDGPA